MTIKSDNAAAAAAAALIKSTAESTATTLNISYIQRDIGEIKQSMKDMSEQFVTRIEFLTIEKAVSENENKLEEMQKTLNMGLGGVAVLTILIPIIIRVFFY